MSTRTRSNVTRGLPFVCNLDDIFNFNLSSCCEPIADVNYEEDKITLDLNLAGTPKENIKVEVDNGKLIIESSKGENEIKKSYELPEDIDSENISAKYENGILYVSIPKSVKASNTKNIEVQ